MLETVTITSTITKKVPEKAVQAYEMQRKKGSKLP